MFGSGEISLEKAVAKWMHTQTHTHTHTHIYEEEAEGEEVVFSDAFLAALNLEG